MSNALNLLGLARRGGNIALGEDSVAEACKTGKAVVVFLASDAGETTANRGRKMAETAAVPWTVIPFTRAELGFALGRAACALAALTDRGLARSVLQKLGAEDEKFLAMAEQLADRKERRNNQKQTVRVSKKPADR